MKEGSKREIMQDCIKIGVNFYGQTNKVVIKYRNIAFPIN